MKFSSREDIAASIDQVFDALCDFEGFERQAMRRGADVQRVDSLKQPGVGMQWRAGFVMRDRKRKLDIEMIRFDSPNEMVLDIKSPGIDGVVTVELFALSRSRTRLSVALELKPLNLSSRVLVQSLKLAKSNLNQRFKVRLAGFTKGLEDKLQRNA